MKLAFYKPSEKGNGSAFQFSISDSKKKEEPVVFIEATKQDGPKPPPGSNASPFNWDNKVVLMLNHGECGEILAYMEGWGNKPILDIVHSTEREGVKSISAFSLKAPITDEEKKFGNWSVTLKRDKNSVMGRLSPGEVYQLKLLCEFAINEFIFIKEKYAKSENTPNTSGSEVPQKSF